MYAKDKADLLIASLTADVHATKADFRPYVPRGPAGREPRRARDGRLRDHRPACHAHRAHQVPAARLLRQGLRVLLRGRSPRTQEEIDTLESYGGEIVFTPGDVVYSSSRLIESSPPKLGVEKLLALMESEGFGFDRLREALTIMRGVRVHVVGDTIVDSYSHCSLLGATAKSPTFSVKHERTEVFAGGAAVVAKHVKAAGGDVSFSTVLGERRGEGLRAGGPAPGGHHRARRRGPHAPHHPEGALHRRRLQDAPGGPGGQPRDLGPGAPAPCGSPSPRARRTW